GRGHAGIRRRPLVPIGLVDVVPPAVALGLAHAFGLVAPGLAQALALVALGLAQALALVALGWVAPLVVALLAVGLLVGLQRCGGLVAEHRPTRRWLGVALLVVAPARFGP